MVAKLQQPPQQKLGWERGEAQGWGRAKFTRSKPKGHTILALSQVMAKRATPLFGSAGSSESLVWVVILLLDVEDAALARAVSFPVLYIFPSFFLPN